MVGMCGIGRMEQALNITVDIWALLIDRQEIGILARQDGISSIHGNAIDIGAPHKGHAGTRPPSVKVEMHASQPSNIPMMRMKVGRTNQGCKVEKEGDRDFHLSNKEEEQTNVVRNTRNEYGTFLADTTQQ
jgi:hypothetical protein